MNTHGPHALWRQSRVSSVMRQNQPPHLVASELRSRRTRLQRAPAFRTNSRISWALLPTLHPTCTSLTARTPAPWTAQVGPASPGRQNTPVNERNGKLCIATAQKQTLQGSFHLYITCLQRLPQLGLSLWLSFLAPPQMITTALFSSAAGPDGPEKKLHYLPMHINVLQLGD